MHGYAVWDRARGEAMRRGIKLRFVHVNCKLGVDSTYALYQTILQKVSPESLGRGYSPSEMLRQTMLHLRRTGEYMLLAIDDVDYLVRTLKEKRGEGGVIFDLTRLNEMYLGEEQRLQAWFS
jgi:Cdc6-like AAA superfamily ATPase